MAAENFNACLAFTLKYEGGLSNDPHDPGGRTMQGVTQATYDAYRAGHGLAQKDVSSMLPPERDAIYRSGYWAKVTGDSLAPGVDLCVFDLAVNSGPARALRAYVTAGHNHVPADAIHDLCSARLSFLRALRTWSYFGAGWAKRVAACEATALAMAGGSLESARDKLRKKKNGNEAQAAVAGGMGVVAIFKSLGMHWMWTTAGIIGIAIIILAFLGKSQQAGGRADALSVAIAKMKAEHDALERTTKAAMAQSAGEALDLLRKQKAIKEAESAIAELGLKPQEK